MFLQGFGGCAYKLLQPHCRQMVPQLYSFILWYGVVAAQSCQHMLEWLGQVPNLALYSQLSDLVVMYMNRGMTQAETDLVH